MTGASTDRPKGAARAAAVPTFLKWAGGKGQLLPELIARAPERFERYHEPFVGSGALFFALRTTGRIAQDGSETRASLADANPHLIQCYTAVRDDVDAVIEALKRHPYEEGHYYEVRALRPETMAPAARAARFLYLNRTGFNGLYRENSRGEFNVPFGRHVNPTICNEDRLLAAAAALQGVPLRCEDFEAAAARADAGDFVYFDPPYVPLNVTSSFTAYHRAGFGEAEQRRLARTFRGLAERGVHVILSNSDAPLVHQLYAGETLEAVLARRAINSKADARGAIRELIVTPGPRPDGPHQPKLL